MSLRLRTFPRIFQTTVRLQRGSRTRGASGLQYKMLWRVESTAYPVTGIPRALTYYRKIRLELKSCCRFLALQKNLWVDREFFPLPKSTKSFDDV